jgi:hypothetical protein
MPKAQGWPINRPPDCKKTAHQKTLPHPCPIARSRTPIHRDRILLPRLSRRIAHAQPSTATPRRQPARRVLGSSPRPARHLLLLSPLAAACCSPVLAGHRWRCLLLRCRRRPQVWRRSGGPLLRRRRPGVPHGPRGYFCCVLPQDLTQCRLI